MRRSFYHMLLDAAPVWVALIIEILATAVLYASLNIAGYGKVSSLSAVIFGSILVVAGAVLIYKIKYKTVRKEKSDDQFYYALDEQIEVYEKELKDSEILPAYQKRRRIEVISRIANAARKPSPNWRFLFSVLTISLLALVRSRAFQHIETDFHSIEAEAYPRSEE